jgi:hypothetical protein
MPRAFTRLREISVLSFIKYALLVEDNPMRCLNCQTVLMDTDTRCVACGMATQADVSAQDRAAYDPNARRKLLTTKWLGGPLAVLVGVILAIVGGNMLYEAQFNRPKPREVAAADLLKVKRHQDLQDWITYDPSETLQTNVQYVRMRSQQATSKFLLLQVKDRWLLAKVAAHHSSWKIEGQLTEVDTLALNQVKGAFPEQSRRLLPYMIDGEYDIAGTSRQNTIMGGFLGGFGILCLISGVGLLLLRVPPLVGTVDESSSFPQSQFPAPPSIPGWTYASQTSAGAYQLQTQLPPQPANTPKPRSRVVRVIFSVVWAVVFFAIGAIIASTIATAGAGNDAERTQLAEESGKKLGPWLLLGSIFLASTLGWLGRLPGTRR